MPYIVFVDDNFHYMDESERYQAGVFEDCESAIAECKRIVNASLEDCDRRFGPEKMFSHYRGFGEDPWIQSPDGNCRFSAWTYAKERCDELAVPLTPEEDSPAAAKQTVWQRIWAFWSE